MKLLETKEQLTLNELLRITYEYGNDGADMPTDSETLEEEFNEWIERSKYLFKKLTIPVIKSVCTACSGGCYYCGKPCGACNGTGYEID